MEQKRPKPTLSAFANQRLSSSKIPKQENALGGTLGASTTLSAASHRNRLLVPDKRKKRATVLPCLSS